MHSSILQTTDAKLTEACISGLVTAMDIWSRAGCVSLYCTHPGARAAAAQCPRSNMALPGFWTTVHRALAGWLGRDPSQVSWSNLEQRCYAVRAEKANTTANKHPSS